MRLFGGSKAKPTAPAAPAANDITVKANSITGKLVTTINTIDKTANKLGTLAVKTADSVKGKVTTTTLYKDISWMAWLMAVACMLVIAAGFIYQTIFITIFLRTYPTMMPMIDLKFYNVIQGYLVGTSLLMGFTFATLIRSNYDSVLISIIVGWIIYNISFASYYIYKYSNDEIWPTSSSSGITSTTTSVDTSSPQSASSASINIINTSFTPLPSSMSPYKTSSMPPIVDTSSAPPSSLTPSSTGCILAKNTDAALAVRNACIASLVLNCTLVGVVLLYMGRQSYLNFQRAKAATAAAAAAATTSK